MRHRHNDRRPQRSARKAARPKRAPKQTQPPPSQPAAAPTKTNSAGGNGSSGFPIVGIGASAGGLEALERFLKHVPERSGMAFVVVQHLDPTHKGAMVELLQRVSAIPVVQVTDRLKVEPDHVYVIPPSSDMSIMHGVLHLLPQASPRGLNLPIDFFFRSLAEDQQERSIGVVLSGMGSDGTLGLRAIKEKAGATFVQSLESAKFEGMPHSAIDAGLADVVVPVEELPGKILAYRRHAPYARPETPLEQKAQSALEKVFILLRTQTGNDFSLYKKSTVYRRIERRMGLHQIDRIDKYVRFLREHPTEVELLFKELLIGVTSFFRDPAEWQHLGKEVLPEVIKAQPHGSMLRAWVPGCSTGEEAYSLAITFKEAKRIKPDRNVGLQIFATDLDREAIDRARLGLYPSNIAADVPPELLHRFFVQEERGYRVGKEIREMVIFAPQNLIMDPPFTKLDILCCRNLLIYLAPELQKRLIPLFHYSLKPGGILFLGTAETVGGSNALFSRVDGKSRIYRRLDAPTSGLRVELRLPLSDARTTLEPEPPGLAMQSANVAVLADRLLLQRYAPAGVLVNEKGDILYITGRTGKYLEPAPGRINWNVLAMAREGLRYDLSKALTTAVREERPVTIRGANVRTNGGTQTVDITVERQTEPAALRGTVMIVIKDVSGPAEIVAPGAPRRPTSARMAQIEKDLQYAREEVQTTREEMQTSQEELKSTNEELQSTNEELQSTNEELNTSKEEMQSLNEELQTVNNELQGKVDELSRSNNDMKNLLNSTDIATLFLDSDLRVRRFTTRTASIIKLIPGDAGRPITDLTTDLDYDDLAGDAREVLRTLAVKEKLVGARDGGWFNVRILPYRTLENVIDGVVITFTDATAATKQGMALREQAEQLRQMTDSLPSLLWSCRSDGFCDYLSRQWTEYTGISGSEKLNYDWLEQVHPEDREQVRKLWKAAARGMGELNAECRIRGKTGAYRWFKTRAVPIRDAEGKLVKWYGTNTDVDDLKTAEAHARQTSENLKNIVDGIDEAFVAIDENLAITYFNTAAEHLLHRKREELLGQRFTEACPEIEKATFEDKFRQVLRDRVPVSFEAHFDHATNDGWYTVRVSPNAEGISVFLARDTSTRSASTADPVRTPARRSDEQNEKAGRR